MSDTDDEDLRKAIALSLLQSSPPRKTEGDVVIDLVSSEDDEEEDDDLDAPVVARLSQNASKSVLSQNEAVQAIPITASTSQHHGSDTIDYAASSPAFKHSAAAANSVSMPKSQPIVTSLQNMDRARMEAERLQRLARMKQMQGQEGNSSRKRKEPDTSSSPLGSGRQGQAKKVSTASTKDHLATFTSPESKSQSKVTPQARPLTLHSNSTDKAIGVISYQDQQRLGAPGIQFPNGTVKKTWVYGCPRTGDDIKIEEVLQKDDLELAVLSAFQVDSDWIIPKLKPTTKVIWVLQAKGEAQKENFRSGAPPNYGFCFPNMEGIVNCMHSKLQLLAHPSHLRIVVPSANLTSYDWGETGQMENVLFLIDLPRLPKSQESHNELTGFGKELIHFLQAMGLKEHTINSIKCFDFKNTEKLAFVHTIGGSHSGSDLFRTGFCGLGNSVRSLGLSTEAALKIDFLAASVGSLNDSFLQSLYLAAQGDNGLKEYKWRTDKGSKNKNKTKDSEPSALLIEDELKTNVKIYFPTRQTVENSRGGRAAGGTICFQRKWYDSATFATARSLMVDCKSQREGILSHSKMIFTRPQEGTTRPWLYLGSANLSESAWGRLVKNKKGELALNCRNWECGVVLAVQEATDNEHGPPKRVDMDMDVFEGHVPVPMAFPGEAYRVEYGEEPWFYSEYL